MSTPFSWESQRTKTIEPLKRTLPQSLMAAVDNMFEGTLNPGAHRQNWFDYLQTNGAGDVSTDLGITDETDLSLMLPPIENIDLPLLSQLRSTLSELNADACCYPYSARNAIEIKTIVNLYNAVKKKANDQKGKVRLKEIKLNKEELVKTGLKVTLMTRPTMTTAERKRNLAQLTTQVSRIRNMRRAILFQKKDLAILQKRQLMFRERLERIFFARPNWKFKDVRSDRTRGGGRAIGSVDRIDPNDIEIISRGQTISHQTIVEAIQERVSGLQQSSIDIHPIPWKNLLIIPYAVQGLSKDWDQAEGSDYRLGQARNKFKTNNFRRASALIATWEQFATFGTKGFANTLQKDLQAHNVKLHAQVEISFDVNGTIRPNVPWWDNEYAAENGKRQVGGNSTAEEEAIRDSYDGLGTGVGIRHTKTSSGGVQFYSQVGFAWQYKIPTHSRSNLRNTDWILATDENGDPFKEFNLPKGTTEYAVRLCFIKADGNVVPLSNVLTGSDVQQKMESLINKQIRGKRFVPHAQRYSVAGKDVSGTREDEKVWTQVSETDRKRLTRKARALLNIQAEVNMETFKEKIVPLKQILKSYDNLVISSEARLRNVRTLNQIVEAFLDQAYERKDDPTGGKRMDGAEFTDPVSGNPIPAPTTGSSGQTFDMTVPLVGGFKVVDASTTPAKLTSIFETSVNVIGTDAYDKENPIDVIQQARALQLSFNDPATNSSIAARESAIDKFNAAASAVEDLEQKMVAWSAGGQYDNFSTEHAPGLVSKDREVTQVISFTKSTFPSKLAKEERENSLAIAAGAPKGPHRRPGYWNPFTEDLPDEACLMLEPRLRTFRDEESLGLLNAGQLRAHNYVGSPALVDVSGETPSIGFIAWKNQQAKIATKFNDAKNPRDLTPDEQRINDFNSRNLASKINFSMKSSRAAALIQAQKTREKEEREKFEKQEAALRAQLDLAQQARDQLQANRAAELDKIRRTDAAAKATLVKLTEINNDVKKAQLELATIEVDIKTLQARIAALDGQPGLTTQQQQDLAADKSSLDIKIQEAKDKESEIDQLEDDLRNTNKQYQDDIVQGIQKKELDLDNKIDEAKAKLVDLNKQFQMTLRAAETAAQTQASVLEKRVALLAKSTKGDNLGLEADIISGNIAIGVKNGRLAPDNQIAPADLRFGGGYYWKEAEDIKSSPFGQYLAYDPAGTKGDRLELMWSELNPDDSTQTKDDVVLYRYTDANTPSVKGLSRRKNVQPVLTDNIFVKGVTTGDRLEPTQNLFRLTKANTTSDKDKSIVYIGRRPVGRQQVDGVNEPVSVLEFFETLPKPGTFVHFVLNKKNADETTVGGAFGDRGRIRNRLRDLSKAFKVSKDLNGDDVIDIDNAQKLVGLTGRIESVHIGNLKTTLNVKKEKDKADQISQLVVNRQDEIDNDNRPVKIKQFTDTIISEQNELDRLRKQNGSFNYGMFKSEGNTYQSVVLVDIRISNDDVTGVVKNVLFADVAVVNPYSNEEESTVLYSPPGERYKEFQASVYQANHDDTITITQGNNAIKVNKENLLPRFDDGTSVMYFSKNTYSAGTITGFSYGTYQLTDDDTGDAIKSNPGNVQALEQKTLDALSVITSVNNDSNTIGSGLRKSQYVALYHLLSVEDVDRGSGVTERYCEELETYVGKSSSAATLRGYSQLNEDNWTKYDNNSDPPAFNSAPDVLFRAEFTPLDPLEMHKVTGDINNQGYLESCLAKLAAPGATSLNLADDRNTYEIKRIMGEVVMVQESGLARGVKDGNGNVIKGQFVTIRYVDKNGLVKYGNIDIADISSIKVPHVAARIDPNSPGVGYTKVSTSNLGNMVPQKAINITAPVRSSLMMAKSMPATFALTSGTEGDTDLMEEDEEKGGWTSSWAKETIATWAASSSSSDEQMLKALSDVEQMVPNWASSSSGDESVEKAAWATSTSASGGFASSTSDDDADDLATIISKIDRRTQPVSAAWAEDSESDD